MFVGEKLLFIDGPVFSVCLPVELIARLQLGKSFGLLQSFGDWVMLAMFLLMGLKAQVYRLIKANVSNGIFTFARAAQRLCTGV